MASGLNFANCLWYEIEQGLLQDRLDWSKDRGRGVPLCFLVESEFHRLRFRCNPSSVRERPRQQLCFSLRETVSTLKRSPSYVT